MTKSPHTTRTRANVIIVFDSILTLSSSVSSQNLYCSLLRDQSRDVTPRLGVIPATIIETIIGVLRPSWLTEIPFRKG